MSTTVKETNLLKLASVCEEAARGREHFQGMIREVSSKPDDQLIRIKIETSLREGVEIEITKAKVIEVYALMERSADEIVNKNHLSIHSLYHPEGIPR